MGIFRRLSALVAAVVLSLNLCAFAANEIYVKNRPFKGSVSTYEGQLWSNCRPSRKPSVPTWSPIPKAAMRSLSRHSTPRPPTTFSRTQ